MRPKVVNQRGSAGPDPILNLFVAKVLHFLEALATAQPVSRPH